MQIGNIVRFSDDFLRDIRGDSDHMLRDCEGIIRELDNGIATIEWQYHARIPRHVLIQNLVISRFHKTGECLPLIVS